MNVATSSPREVGVRELKNNLSRYLHCVSDGDELVVTDRGRPVARLVPLDTSTDALSALIERGIVHPPEVRERSRPARGVTADGTVSDLVAEQRR